MQTKLWGTKILVTGATAPELQQLRRNAVNHETKGSTFIVEDNIFNRTLLGIDYPEFMFETEKACAVSEAARAYQKKDIEHMLRLRYVMNRNKPGYGKTFESIEYCRVLGLKKILVVCPKSVRSQWKKEFKRWWPEVEQHIVNGGPGVDKEGWCVYITNYESFTPRRPRGSKRDIMSQTWMKCKTFSWDVIILDESHRIKNAGAKITTAIKDLPGFRRMCLTGTPILGRPDDLWSQLHFLAPFYSGGSYWEFAKRFCELEHNGFGNKPIGLTPSSSAQDLLARVLAEITVGGDNHKLTEGKNIIEIELDMDQRQRKLYHEITSLCLDSLAENGITIKNAMDQIIKQQQVTTNCSRFLRGEKEIVCPRNPKFEWIADWLEDNEGEKVVIFSKFAETINALQSYLSTRKYQTVTYHGKMSERVRAEAKEYFVQHSSCRAILGTIGALGTGVDGLQDVCRNVIFLDRDWTPGINEQAEERVNRSGQVGMTNVWILYMKKSIDKYVEGIQTKKANDIKEIFELVNSYGAGSGE